MADIDPIKSGPHGNSNPIYLGQYSKGCRCEECVEAHREYHRLWQTKKKIENPRYFADNQAIFRTTDKWAVAYKAGRDKVSASPELLAKLVAASAKRSTERRAILAKMKTDAGCCDCAYREHACALDFDHVKDGKTMEVSEMCTFSMKRIMAEVSLCVVRCYRCHRVKTLERLKSGESKWVRKRVTDPGYHTIKMARYRERGRAFLSAYKLSHGCCECGYCPSSVLILSLAKGIQSYLNPTGSVRFPRISDGTIGRPRA